MNKLDIDFNDKCLNEITYKKNQIYKNVDI